MHAFLRGPALLAGTGILLVAVWGVFIVLLVGGMTAQAPDPFIADGDPCCGHPDTWGEVRWGIVWTLAYAIADALLFSLAVALVRWGWVGRWPRLKRLALLPAGAVILTSLALAAAIVPLLDEGRTPPDCDSFGFDRSAWRSSDADARRDVAYGLSHCGLLDGRSARHVRRLLGRPTFRDRAGNEAHWLYGGLAVYFADGRVTRTDVGLS